MFRPFNSIQYPLYFPDEVIDKPVETVDDIIDFLKDDTDDKETIDITEKKDDKTKDKTNDKVLDKDDVDDESVKEEDDELKELEEELEEPDEEKLELMAPVKRREILKKYPKLFEDFPYLERAYYREQQYTELIPTIEDAKLAVEKSSTLDKFENQLMAGETTDILKAVKETDENAFNKIIDNYLPTLAAVDEKAYHHVIGNVIKRTIIEMVREARANESNKSLEGAAQLLNQFVFGVSNFSNPTNLTKPDEKKPDDELKRRESEFNERRFNDAREGLTTKVTNVLKNTIEANIDPKDSMTSYVKRHAQEECLSTLESLMNQDNRFRILVDKLWEKAVNENYNSKSLDNIRSAFVSKAKTLLPSVIKKARNEALKGLGKRVSNDKDEVNDTTDKKTDTKSRDKSTSPSNIKSGDKVPKGMSTLDFLNS